jgi:hypothetical protein
MRTAGGRRLLLGVLVGVVAVVLAGASTLSVLYVTAPDGDYRHVPGDGCAMIPGPDLTEYVPDGVITRRVQTRTRASCRWRDGTDRASLEISVVVSGKDLIPPRSAGESAHREFLRLRARYDSRNQPGLGDEAFRGEDGTTVAACVRQSNRLVLLRYTPHDVALAGEAVIILQQVLANMPE